LLHLHRRHQPKQKEFFPYNTMINYYDKNNFTASSDAAEKPPVAMLPAETPNTSEGLGVDAAGVNSLDYDSFIISKSRCVANVGFDPMPIYAPLFPFQRHVVEWAIRKGRAAMFEECGLGKTLQQLEWASQVAMHTGGAVIVLTPLAVASQTLAEAERFGIAARVVRQPEDVSPGINITNYEKLDIFDDIEFAGVVLDESSILKNFTGKTRIKLTERFSTTPYRLCCTATPSPNDYTEFGQHADFLGICTPGQMLATFFINDTFNTGDWRLKKHADAEFWQWVASWAACIGKPSDIGFDDDGYILPSLNLETITVDVDETAHEGSEELFKHATLSATTMHKELRETADARAEAVASMVNGSDETWIVWCNTNVESDALMKRIPDAVEVRGSDRPEQKETRLSNFTNGKTRVLVSKPSICGFGMNWQHCRNVAFVGLSYSFEDFYQALRRSYRFGQDHEVNAYIVQARTEGAILATVKRKMDQHSQMQERMKLASVAFRDSTMKNTPMKTDINTAIGDGWEMHHGDCVRVARKIKDESIDFSVFSPPFADLFTYSDDPQDMGNCFDLDEFRGHFEILIAEMLRIMKPGRIVAVHCVELLATKWKDGHGGGKDFPGEIIRMFWKHGFIQHSPRITIWKSPVTEMQRTKAHGLLYKTLKADSCDSRVGCADYLLIFKKPGENPKPVTKNPDKYPVDWWQEVASPVWMTVDQGRVLNKGGARDHADERHICPLQLDVIERAVELWSNEGDIVYSPFTGIGSEGVGALELGRRFIGSELKESYFNQAVQNLKNAKSQLSLF
jgi:DNA modification methylase